MGESWGAKPKTVACVDIRTGKRVYYQKIGDVKDDGFSPALVSLAYRGVNRNGVDGHLYRGMYWFDTEKETAEVHEKVQNLIHDYKSGKIVIHSNYKRKDIKLDYGEDIKITEDGKVLIKKKDGTWKEASTYIGDRGRVCFSYKGKNSLPLKRAMWEYFNGELDSDYVVRLKDGDELNVSLDNLFIVERSELAKETCANSNGNKLHQNTDSCKRAVPIVGIDKNTLKVIVRYGSVYESSLPTSEHKCNQRWLSHVLYDRTGGTHRGLLWEFEHEYFERNGITIGDKYTEEEALLIHHTLGNEL